MRVSLMIVFVWPNGLSGYWLLAKMHYTTLIVTDKADIDFHGAGGSFKGY